MKKYQFITLSVLLSLILLTGMFYIGRVSARPRAQVDAAPDVVSYQGRVTQSGSPFTGTGHFKFAVVDSAGSTTYWSNDGTSSGGSEPSSAVQLTVAEGLFNVLLGDTDLSNMTSLPSSVFDGPDRYLRVWFSPSGSSFTRLSPDRKIASVPYALKAQDAETLGGKDSSAYVTQTQLDAQLTALQTDVSALQSKLNAVTVKNSGQDVVFEGVNVHIVDGSGDTDGTTNGVGNLIIGYNEDSGNDASRGGSHNLVVGPEHSYSSYGGIVAGWSGTISARHASVLGGNRNTASGDFSSVSGGELNKASGDSAQISGGYDNLADFYNSSVSGGRSGQASGEYTSVLGGRKNSATGDYATVVGGGGPAGSDWNRAWAHYSTVVGGRTNTAGNVTVSRSDGVASVILGGESNLVTEDYGIISGGYNNTVSGGHASLSGGRDNTASGNYSAVSGGNSNTAGGAYSVIGGGLSRSVSGNSDWRAGDAFQDY